MAIVLNSEVVSFEPHLLEDIAQGRINSSLRLLAIALVVLETLELGEQQLGLRIDLRLLLHSLQPIGKLLQQVLHDLAPGRERGHRDNPRSLCLGNPRLLPRALEENIELPEHRTLLGGESSAVHLLREVVEQLFNLLARGWDKRGWRGPLSRFGELVPWKSSQLVQGKAAEEDLRTLTLGNPDLDVGEAILPKLPERLLSRLGASARFLTEAFQLLA